MQDPAMFQSMKLPHFPEHEQLKCPRCDSTNTKFCYYNNYNLSQPRHFCKNCRRYWTKGGALRNIPVGGGTRKSNPKKPNSKKPSSSSSSSSTSSSPASAPPAALEPAVPKPEPAGLYSAGQAGSDHDQPRMLDVPGGFNSLLSANGQFVSLMEGVNLGAAAHHTQELVFGEYMENGRDQVSGTAGGSMEETRDSSCWNGANGWPDLAIYTPSSRFQ